MVRPPRLTPRRQVLHCQKKPVYNTQEVQYPVIREYIPQIILGTPTIIQGIYCIPLPGNIFVLGIPSIIRYIFLYERILDFLGPTITEPSFPTFFGVYWDSGKENGNYYSR